jgi:hypothetical protein
VHAAGQGHREEGDNGQQDEREPDGGDAAAVADEKCHSKVHDLSLVHRERSVIEHPRTFARA